MFIQIGNWNTHFFKVITGNISNFVHIDSIVIGIMRIIFFISIIFAIQYKFFMSFIMVKICIPTNCSKTSPFFPILVDPKSRSSWLVVVGNSESHISKFPSKPNFILLYQGKYFFIGNIVLISYNKKFLLVLHQQCDILTKQTERRICNYYVSLFQIFNTLI